MKIAFIGTRGIPNGYASAEQIAYQVGRRMITKGHSYSVYCWSNFFADHEKFYEGIERIFLPTFNHKIFGQLIHSTISGIHSISRNYDIVHFQCLTNAFQSFIPWLIKRNTIINVNGQEWDNPKWPKTYRHWFFKSAVHLTLFMQKEIITDAEGMYELYLERYNRKSTIIEYGAEIIESKNPQLLDSFNIKPKQYYFIAARLVPSNQIDKIISAFNHSKSNKILVIAGGGAFGSIYYNDLRKNSGNRIKFIGMISDQNLMNELYSNAYAYLHGASLGGINSALLRPLGAGCPAIAFDTPFNREVIEIDKNVHCGHLWRTQSDLTNAINFFDSNSDKIREYSILSRIHIKRNFSWDLVADQYEVFYTGIIERWPLEKIRQSVKSVKLKYH